MHSRVDSFSHRTQGLALLVSTLIAGCGAQPATAQIALEVGSGQLTLAVGEQVQLNIAVSTAAASAAYTVEYHSTDATLVGVSKSGLVTGLGDGTTSIAISARLVEGGAAATQTVGVTVGSGSPATPTTTPAMQHEIDVANAMSDTGFAWRVAQDFGTPPDSDANDAASSLRIFEDGKELGPAHAAHADIRALGHGLFSHWNDQGSTLRFATSDNSDPRTNGRSYTYTIGTGAADAGVGGTPDIGPPPPTPTTAGQVTETFTADTTTDFLNPERGFYVTPKDGEMNVSALTGFVNSWHTRLFLYLIDLSPYRTSALPQSFLDALDARFAAGRAAGVKFIVMPVYNYDSSGADASIALTLQHIAQLKPVLMLNADVIPFAKAGYVGAWGEWHDSASGLDSDANKLAIKNAILANTPASMTVHFRYPLDISKWFPSNPTGAAAARIGGQNDCYMANDTDAHTYTGLADPLRDYIKTMSSTSGFGGETCDNVSNPEQRRTSCAQALTEHTAYHLSWLNGAYSPLFIQAWKDGGCFDQISRSMGYRFQLDSVSHVPSTQRGATIAVTVSLRNTGWSSILSDRKIVVTLRHKTTGALITGTGDSLRNVKAGATAQLTANVTIPTGAAVGDYAVELGVPDIYATTASDARYSVRFANANNGSQTWDPTTARFSTGGSVTVASGL